MKKLLSIISVFFILISTAKAEMSFGVGLMAGQVSASGTETEGAAADTSTRNKSFEELFVGADIFVEKELNNGVTLGLSIIPFDIELASGERTDSSTGANVASEADTGTRTAQAELENLMTLYGNFPIGGEGTYLLGGIHYTKVSTSETLPNSSYGDENIFGGQIGIGRKDGNAKVELFYSDFEKIDLSSTGGDNSNSVSADADAVTLRISYGF